jgi:hypothetical protein
MHLIRDKVSKKVLAIDYRQTEERLKGNELTPDFDPLTMEIGWTDKTYIPGHYDIDHEGVIIELPLPKAEMVHRAVLPKTHKLVEGQVIAKTEDELIQEGVINIEDIKKQMLENIDNTAFNIRETLIPNYKLQNAALGIYGKERNATYSATIQAFRDEYHRLEDEISKASTAVELRAIQPRFPDKLIDN